jgi:ribosomal protein S18 acetylase RimI-like enzyme
MTPSTVRELEEVVVGAWPARDTQDLDGWLLRASGGPTHRGNSVATLAANSELGLVQRIARAEAWYAEREQASMFQVGPCVAPADLDLALAARGYHKAGEALLARASPDVVVRSTPCTWAVSVAAQPSPEWLRVAAAASRFAATRGVFLGCIARLGARSRFVAAHSDDGRAAATCLGIWSGQRLGVYAMLSLPEARRRGAGRAVLHALARSAIADGARELYLLVEPSNIPALALYTSSGFEELYRYHYRVLPRTG